MGGGWVPQYRLQLAYLHRCSVQLQRMYRSQLLVNQWLFVATHDWWPQRFFYLIIQHRVTDTIIRVSDRVASLQPIPSRPTSLSAHYGL